MELETNLKSLCLVLLIILSLLIIGLIVIYIYYKMKKRSQSSVLGADHVQVNCSRKWIVDRK